MLKQPWSRGFRGSARFLVFFSFLRSLCGLSWDSCRWSAWRVCVQPCTDKSDSNVKDLEITPMQCSNFLPMQGWRQLLRLYAWCTCVDSSLCDTCCGLPSSTLISQAISYLQGNVIPIEESGMHATFVFRNFFYSDFWRVNLYGNLVLHVSTPYLQIFFCSYGIEYWRSISPSVIDPAWFSMFITN